MKKLNFKPIRITGTIDEKLKARLRASLAAKKKTFCSWLRENAEREVGESK